MLSFLDKVYMYVYIFPSLIVSKFRDREIDDIIEKLRSSKV